MLRGFFDVDRYPTSDDKQSLAQLTKLSITQVDNWFRNHRQRKLPHSMSVSSTLPQTLSHIGRNAPSTGQHQGYGQYTQPGNYSDFDFSAVLANSPIAANLSNPQGHDGGYGRQSPSLRAFSDLPPREDVQPITSSYSVTGDFVTRQTSDLTIMPVGQLMGQEDESSDSWVDLPQPAESQSYSMSRESTRMSSASNSNMMGPSSTPGRQGRRKVDHIKMHPRERTHCSKIYQCIWCYLPFKTSSDMRRHMETQHALQNVYICMRGGLDGLRVLNQSKQQICILCHSLQPDDNHFYASHNASGCVGKNLEERSFYRDDHLARHIKTMHGKGTYDLPGLAQVVKEWKAPSNDRSWYCGFCSIQVGGWAMFIPHISKHFSDGQDMTNWKDGYN